MVASYRSGRIAMASGGAALACFSDRALAGLPSPLLVDVGFRREIIGIFF